MSHIAVVEGSVRRVQQLTGEWQREPDGRRAPTRSRTASRAGLVGTDLGSSFTDGARTWFLFGDTWPDPALADSFAWTTDADPEAGITLHVLGEGEGAGTWRRPTVTGAPGGTFRTGPFEVPTGGFVVEGTRYVLYTTDWRVETVPTPQGPRTDNVMGACALLRQRVPGDDPELLADLQWVFELSRESAGGHFVNAAPVVVADPPAGLPFAGPAVLLFGSGRYRHSDAYLAAAPATRASVESAPAWRFLTGVRDGVPQWTGDQRLAAPLFARPEGDDDGGIGELSAARIGPLGVWLLTYGMTFRTAPTPWGPWGPPRLLDNAGKPVAVPGQLLHRTWDDAGPEGTDLLYDRGRGMIGGGPYGPYLIERWTRGLGPGRARIWFTLSSWNPYQSHLMTAVLERRPADDVFVPRTPVAVGVAGAARTAFGPLVGDHGDVHPRFPDLLGDLPTGGVCLIGSRFGPKGNNWELVVPRRRGGLIVTSSRNDPWPPAWGSPVVMGEGPGERPGGPVPYTAASMIVSDAGDGPDPAGNPWDRQRDRLVVAAVTGDRVVWFSRDRQPPWDWSGPYPVIAVEDDDSRHPLVGVRGNPALVASTYGARKANWELFAPDATAGVRHFWFDNDPTFPMSGDWRLAPTFAASLGRVDAVAAIQSVFGDAERGNLEVVVRRGGELFVLWRDAALTWSAPFPLVASNGPVTGADGVPGLLQSAYHGRDFQLVTPLAGGGLAYLWRDNRGDDPAAWRWVGPAVLDPGVAYASASLVQGPFGPEPGNLELVATTASGQLRHFWRESASTNWHDAGVVVV